MSKTASEWTEEGNAFDDEERLEEAIKCFDTAISIDPTFGRAYALKAYTIKKNDKFQEAADLNHKAIELGYKQDWVYNNLGQIYTFHIKKREEAIKMLDEALAISPNYADAFLNKGNALTALGKVKEANECFMKCINNNGNSAEACIMIGSALEDEGKKDEAMVYYNKGLEINSSDYKSRLLKANLLNEQGKTDEALTIYKSMLGDWPTDSIVNYQLSRIYTRLGKTEEATKCCEQAAKMNAENSAAYCAKGQCLNILGRAKEAMECFEKAKDLIENGTEVYASWFERSMKTALKAILEAEEVAKKVESELSKFDQNSKTVQKFKTNIKLLQEKKVNLQNQTIDQAGKKTTDGNNHQLSELDKIKADFQKQLDDLKKEMGEFKSEVKTEIKNLKNNMDEMKEELNSKMDDFNKKVDIELDKHDLSQEDKIKVKGYFAAFVGTFSSAHVSAQVVDSGQVSLDTDSTAATVLSFMASFTPFIGSALESGVKSIGDFLKGKEMKANARKMKTLAADAVALSQLIGKAGFGIVQNKEKRDQIINITDRELDKQSGNLLEKMMKLCDDISEKLDAFLYTELYKTPAERLGHADANKLIEKWVNRKITPYSIHEQFIEIILYPATEKEIKPATEAPSAGRSSCCNLF